MQREIKFRGKRVDNGEWVEGFYVDLSGIKKGWHMIETVVDGHRLRHEVLPESVGQYTGLKDRNGKEIYEGDILKIQLPAGGFWGNIKLEKTGYVQYESDFGGFIARWEYSKNQHHIGLGCDIAFDCTITRNTIDNPELIKP